jgi:hypothetical protein
MNIQILMIENMKTNEKNYLENLFSIISKDIRINDKNLNLFNFILFIYKSLEL